MAQYIKISRLQKIQGKVLPSDMFLISRKNDEDPENEYDSRSLTYDKLSSDIFNKTLSSLAESHAIIMNELSTINKMEDAVSGGKRIVQENCVNQLKQRISNVDSNYDNALNKNTINPQEVVGGIKFNSNISVIQYPNKEYDAINKQYIDDITEGYGNPTSKYSIPKTYPNVEKCYNIVGNAETTTGYNIRIDDALPIVFFTEIDAMYQIKIFGPTTRIGIYTYQTNEKNTAIIRELIKQDVFNKKSDNFSLVKSLVSSDKFYECNIPFQSGCVVCIFPKIDINTQVKNFPYMYPIVNYNIGRIEEHLKQPESYTDNFGYYFHFNMERDSKGNPIYTKVYEKDGNNRKYMKIGTEQREIKQINTTPSWNTKFQKDNVINILKYIC